MKPSRVFWGVLFVALGALFLLGRSYDWDLEYAWKLWPVVLILIGVAVILKDSRFKWILAAAAALLTAFILYSFLNLGWLHCHEDGTIVDSEGPFDVQEFSEPFIPTIERATFILEAAAGRFSIDTTSKQLLAATVNSNIGRYSLERSSAGEMVTLHLQPEGEVRFRNWKVNRSLNTVHVKLNSAPLWDMEYEIGAAAVDLDLTPLRVERLSIEAGAASVRLKLGMHPDETHLKLEAGASKIRLSIPERAGCEITIEEGLSSKRFGDFEKVGDGTYRTANFESATRKIFVDAETGVSSISVVRY